MRSIHLSEHSKFVRALSAFLSLEGRETFNISLLQHGLVLWRFLSSIKLNNAFPLPARVSTAYTIIRLLVTASQTVTLRAVC